MYFCFFTVNRGALKQRAEIIPKKPDPDNAGGGITKKHTFESGFVFLGKSFENPLFYFINPMRQEASKW